MVETPQESGLRGQPYEGPLRPERRHLPDSSVLELFWRWYLGQQLAVTPDVQYLMNPARNPNESSIWLFGLRARFVL